MNTTRLIMQRLACTLDASHGSGILAAYGRPEAYQTWTPSKERRRKA